jgi:hypothetical protein
MERIHSRTRKVQYLAIDFIEAGQAAQLESKKPKNIKSEDAGYKRPLARDFVR